MDERGAWSRRMQERVTVTDGLVGQPYGRSGMARMTRKSECDGKKDGKC